jgi:uncharacterized coiled-coil DUF342 family protein
MNTIDIENLSADELDTLKPEELKARREELAAALVSNPEVSKEMLALRYIKARTDAKLFDHNAGKNAEEVVQCRKQLVSFEKTHEEDRQAIAAANDKAIAQEETIANLRADIVGKSEQITTMTEQADKDRQRIGRLETSLRNARRAIPEAHGAIAQASARLAELVADQEIESAKQGT